MNPMMKRKSIANIYPALLAKMDEDDNFLFEGKNLAESVAVYQRMAERCRDHLTLYPDHEAILDDFCQRLDGLDDYDKLANLVIDISTELLALERVWLYQPRKGSWKDLDEAEGWLITEVNSRGFVREMAWLEKEDHVLKLLSMFGSSTGNRPTTSSMKSDCLPQDYACFSMGGERYELFHYPDGEDAGRTILLGWTKSDFMAHMLCETIAGYH